jgi:hypothetical protein
MSYMFRRYTFCHNIFCRYTFRHRTGCVRFIYLHTQYRTTSSYATKHLYTQHICYYYYSYYYYAGDLWGPSSPCGILGRLHGSLRVWAAWAQHGGGAGGGVKSHQKSPCINFSHSVRVVRV